MRDAYATMTVRLRDPVWMTNFRLRCTTAEQPTACGRRHPSALGVALRGLPWMVRGARRSGPSFEARGRLIGVDDVRWQLRQVEA